MFLLKLQYLVVIGAAVHLVGFFSYIRGTIRGVTRPNRVTWLMWAIAPLIAAVAALANGVQWAALPVFASGFGPLLIFSASFVNKNSYWKLGFFDYLCGALSALALALWWITDAPVVAIFFAILSDGAAALPTLSKAWRYPATENAVPYLTGLLNAMSSFAAIRMWSFSEYAFPAYLILLDITMAFFVLRKRFAA